MNIVLTLYKHCVCIIKTKKSDVGIFPKYVSHPDAVNMNLGLDKYGKPLMKETHQRAKRLREFNTQLNMCIESILLLLKRKEKINLKRWLELESKIIRHHVHFFFDTWPATLLYVILRKQLTRAVVGRQMLILVLPSPGERFKLNHQITHYQRLANCIFSHKSIIIVLLCK